MIARDTARILSKGKSFEHSIWRKYIQYTNDCFKQDFVTFNNTLLVCVKSHLSSDDNKPNLIYSPDNPARVIGINSEYWELVLSNIPGSVYIPEYDKNNGIITWRISQSIESADSIKVQTDSPWEKTDSGGTIFGSSPEATGEYSIASGFESVAEGDFSQAFGYGTKTTNEYEASFGRFNNSTEDTLFSIGNGNDDSNRQNVFEITKNGDIYVSGTFKIQDLISEVQILNEKINDLNDESWLEFE